MNFTNYFKRKNYDNVDRFLLQQKFRSCRDPFEGDPFKMQSFNFRYADKPKFYPINNRLKPFGNAEKPQIQNVYYNPPNNNFHYRFEKENRTLDNAKQHSLLKNARKSSSVYSFSAMPKPEKFASSSMPEPSRQQLFQRGVDSVGTKIDFNRSRSFIHQPMSFPLTEEAALPNRQTALKKNVLKSKNSIGTKKRSDSMTAINVDHGSGCKITIKINGVRSNQVHINEKDEQCDSLQNRTESVTNPATSPYELKPSRSYVIHKDDTAADICIEQSKSPGKLLRECSTHSMIPHKEERSTLKEFRKSFSVADAIGSSSSLRLKTGSRDKTLLNSTKSNSHNVLESIARKNPLTQRSTSGINLERQASMLERILSNNMIVAPSRKSFLLTKSKSVLDQRFTPLPMSGKYTFENDKSRTR